MNYAPNVLNILNNKYLLKYTVHTQQKIFRKTVWTCAKYTPNILKHLHYCLPKTQSNSFKYEALI